ncbi:MAG: 2OG-Fe(II) oxygenase [Proteobacteria bacterium]|nr:2OG-Fe(II) oxygenase [Pseudomonadota bacterium]
MSSADKIWRARASEAVIQSNPVITQAFLECQRSPDVRKTHLFEGRYENIYLNEQHIPQLTTLMKEAVAQAEDILSSKNLNTGNLSVGYWFNYMPPGSTTTSHTHDDDDELLSGVYYLYVPEDSGNLIINLKDEDIEITPQAGDFIFFDADARHEVSRNNSELHRLSIGMNFGIRRS